MEISLLSPTTLRIKGKKASLIVDPVLKMPRTSSDAIISLGNGVDTSRVDEYRLLVSDSGEYEIGGIKITGEDKNGGLFYGLNVDGSQAILGKVSALSKSSDTSTTAETAILNVDANLDEALIASLEAKNLILYGEKAEEGLKALGKNDVSSTKKFQEGKQNSSSSEETKIIWLS